MDIQWAPAAKDKLANGGCKLNFLSYFVASLPSRIEMWDSTSRDVSYSIFGCCGDNVHSSLLKTFLKGIGAHLLLIDEKAQASMNKRIKHQIPSLRTSAYETCLLLGDDAVAILVEDHEGELKLVVLACAREVGERDHELFDVDLP